MKFIELKYRLSNRTMEYVATFAIDSIAGMMPVGDLTKVWFKDNDEVIYVKQSYKSLISCIDNYGLFIRQI